MSLGPPPPPPETHLPNFPFIEVQPGIYLRADAGRSFQRMADAAKLVSIDLPLDFGFCSREMQAKRHHAYLAAMKHRSTRKRARPALPPGKSIHQEGIAIDIAGVDPKDWDSFRPKRRAWLDANASGFGWYNTGALFKEPEMWHFAFQIQIESQRI